MKLEEEVLDKRGRRYQLRLVRGTEIWRLRLSRRGLLGRHIKAGEATLLPQDAERFVLADLCLEPQYRSLDLGSKLLDAAIEVARSAGGKRLTGNISVADLRATPHLLRLYESRGFTAGTPSEAGWAASVELLL